MARNGSGTYNLLTNSWQPAVNGVTATASDWNALITDIANAITQSVSNDGQTTITGVFNYGANRISNVGAATTSGDALSYGQSGAVLNTLTVTTTLTANGVTQPLGTNNTTLATTAFAMTMQSPAFSGTPTAPTAALGTNNTQIANMAAVQQEIANVNAQTPITMVVDSSAAISASAGQHIVCTNASTVTVTLPASPVAGDTIWITVGNGRTDTVVARNTQNIMSLAEDMTINNASATAQLRFVNSTLGWRLL